MPMSSAIAIYTESRFAFQRGSNMAFAKRMAMMFWTVSPRKWSMRKTSCSSKICEMTSETPCALEVVAKRLLDDDAAPSGHHVQAGIRWPR